MCGIFGYFTTRQDVAERINLETALASMRHRGPDDQRTWRGSAAQSLCGFAFTRLAIIDLSPSAQQPMISSDGRYVIVFNGEIYNFRELRHSLERLGTSFRSTSDTEVLLESLARSGPACLERLRGMFAFAVFDTRNGSLFLARDRLGIKPLYWTHVPGGVAFASEVRTLLATGLAARRANSKALLGYLAFGSVPDPGTMLEGVYSLLPGHSMEVDATSLRRTRYWSLSPRPADVGFSSVDEAAEELRAELREAVRQHLVADVPTGLFLSGGVDSSAIVALASQVSSTPLHTFTVELEETHLDEAAYARATARRFGCEHHTLHLSAHEALQSIDSAVAALDQPSADGINTYFVARAARQAGITVALSGLGGDELFAGYPMFRYIRFLLAASRGWSKASRLLKGLGWLEAALPHMPQRVRKALALLAEEPTVPRLYRILRSMFTPVQCAQLLGARMPNPEPAQLVSLPRETRASEAPSGEDVVNSYGALELCNYLRNTLLRDADVMSMASSLEVRVPFVDHHIVELAARVPGSWKVLPGENKPVLTRAVPTIPQSAVSRPKKGFVLPFDSWMRGPLRGWVEERLLSGTIAGVLESSAVEETWRDYLSGGSAVNYSRIWCLTALSEWCGRHKVSA